MKKIWLFSRDIDLGILFLPVWLIWIVSFLLPPRVYQLDIPIWIWVIFILGVDVSHVWSTLFRTYLDKEEFSNHRRLLITTPILVFILFSILSGISVDFFWRILAYFAVYHFIKQQYGFLALYRIRSGVFLKKKVFKDKWVIYFSMLYPVFFWHLNADRNFDWFVSGDFIYFRTLVSYISQFSGKIIPWINAFGNILYFIVLGGWIAEEIRATIQAQAKFQTGKVLWLLTTAFNWYLGIVLFNSDLIFTLTNVVAHGVPYMALIFFYIESKRKIKNPALSINNAVLQIFFMIVFIFMLAFGEEYLWDLWLFREKGAFFASIVPYFMEAFRNPVLQALAFGILSVPQVTHYVLDGYIWKGNKKNPYIKKIFRPQTSRS